MSDFKLENSQMSSADELQQEISSLKRKLSLAEENLKRAQLISVAQNRVDDIINDSLKKELQYFNLVLENATNILLLLDFDGRFAYASNTFLTSANIANFGLISGKYFRDVLKPIISEKNLENFSDAMNKVIIDKDTISIEEQIDFGFQENMRTFSILITPMTDEENRTTGIMALFNDITEINNAMETAKRANEAKSEFLANMSHEIRTPLNAITGMITIARSSSDMEKIYYCLDKISESSVHLLGVINDILDMSKIESNHFELSFSEFVFEKMLLRIIDIMRFKIEEKNIEFNFHCAPEIPYVISSDEQRLAQVIMNILSNAIKFTPDNGKITVRADLDKIEDDECTIMVSITDSGIGISEEQMPRLFNAFSQADSSISRKFGGTGLGLVISKRIVNLLGGDILVNSHEGMGTTFTFTIKAKACQLNPIINNDYNGIKIFVFDKIEDVLLIFSQYSKKLNIECNTSTNIEESYRILKENNHNIIFIDWKTLGDDRIDIIKKVIELPNHPMIVVMISESEWSDVEDSIKSFGATEFITKPILLPVLENTLEKYNENLYGKRLIDINDFEGKSILLVDDVKLNLEIVVMLLEPTNLKIDCAENGVAALRMYKEAPDKYDMIFMDVQMPEMDGYEATRCIRDSGLRTSNSIPIVAMTANVFKEDIERCIVSGMNDHIGKPISFEEIINKIKYWANRDKKNLD